jgi:ornithine--oxo-acid transaminase
MDIFKKEQLALRASRQGERLMQRLESMANRSPHIREVRGKGLFIGIEVNKGNAMEFCRDLLKLGVLANDSHGHTIRISPPLVINDNELDFMTERLERVLCG